VFWEGAERGYEDAAERLALRAMLPRQGQRLVDLGAGFGRLADEYTGYQDVILVDYARSMLEDARRRLGVGYTYVCADLYHLPFATGAIDAIVQVRVLHHVACIEDAFREVARVLAPGGTYVLEFANKRHAKAAARRLLRRSPTNPFDQEPHEFVPLNWDFHPNHVERALAAAGLTVRQRRAVSLFRQRHLKRLVPPRALARLDALLGPFLGATAPAPSQFVRSVRAAAAHRPAAALWRCPACGREPLPSSLVCPACGRLWPLVDGIHMFREDSAPD
jgi:SAM-dependent methyltransferase